MVTEAQTVPGLVPVVLAEGTPEELAGLEILDELYEEGDLGELQLFIQAVPEDGKADVEAAVEELDQALRERGALPWPGATRIASLDWPNRTVIFRFEQGVAFLAVLAAALVSAATAILAIALVVQSLERLGIPIPDVITDVADAIALAGTIAVGAILLRRLIPIPLSLLIGGGFLIFALLRPDLAWRAIKWVAERALDILERLGLQPAPLLMGLAAGAVSLGVFYLGMQRVLR